MTEAAGGEQDDTTRYIEEVIRSLHVDGPTAEDEALRGRAAEIMGNLPTWSNPIEGKGLDNLPEIVGELGERILEAGINQTVANRYVLPVPPEAVRRPEGYIGALPGERTTRIHCLAVASEPGFTHLDAKVRAANQAVDQHTGSLNDRARVMHARRDVGQPDWQVANSR
jgi:hypothetical protein